MPRCSIIIPVYNRMLLTRRCLNAILECPPLGGDFELIVVDDASSDSTPSLLAEYGQRVRVVTHTQNTGFARTCNDGASSASGDYLVFLNNDTIPQRGWLDALVRYADGHPQAAVVGSKLLFPNDTIQHAGVVIDQTGWPRHIYAGFPADHPAVNKSRRYQIVTAACALFRREAFERVGGFDTVYRNSVEDVDICLRLGELGAEIHYCHESVLYHLESVSEGRHDYDQHNTKIYLERWFPRVQWDDIHYYLEDELLKLSYPNMSYSMSYPVQIYVSPALATVRQDADARQVDELLTLRSRQVFELLKENIWQSIRLKEFESDGKKE
jgi:GT2 family glycosyltransferase